jgi:hypothetical protein
VHPEQVAVLVTLPWAPQFNWQSLQSGPPQGELQLQLLHVVVFADPPFLQTKLHDVHTVPLQGEEQSQPQSGYALWDPPFLQYPVLHDPQFVPVKPESQEQVEQPCTEPCPEQKLFLVNLQLSHKVPFQLVSQVQLVHERSTVP